MYIGVFAYGESRFDLTFNPCNANIYSLCPMNSSVPISASGIIPVAQSDVAGVPDIALVIPDFEGQAILRIFANSTETQIGCYSAVLTNGATFSQPAAIGSILGIFAVVALVSSIAVAIYGEHMPETRKHYAHSVSVWVVFAVYHHIYFTGALSMNWPSVLVAFWSNYAWSAGIIHSQKMQNSINQLIGSNRGNISMVGAAASGVDAENLGGGYSISQIYKRAAKISFQSFEGLGATLRPREIEYALTKRVAASNSSRSSFYGVPVQPGLPLPGNFSGFAGTLSEEGIPLSNAFMTAFLWFLILLACLIGGIVILKFSLEALFRFRSIKSKRFQYFRDHWLHFTGAVIARACFIGFFMFMLLTMFQFTLSASRGVTAIAAVVFVMFYLGMMSLAAYALYSRLRVGNYAMEPDRLNMEKRKLLGFIPWYAFMRESKSMEQDKPKTFTTSLPWKKVHFVDDNPERPSIHEDGEYNVRFGWLSARFRRTKWWSFTVWLMYEFIRACFYGGAAGHPLTQVFGLLIVECIGLFTIIWMRPFEATRLNLIMIYSLGFSKVVTVALSAAFDIRFNLDRIVTTVIGIVIIVIQGILTILLLLAIVLGTVSSYMSVTRYNQEFHPKSWSKWRTKHFQHIDQAATDLPPPPAPPPAPVPLEPESPKEPYFSVTSVKRQPKIEDEDDDKLTEANASYASLPGTGHSEVNRSMTMHSMASSSNLPYGARRHRLSWSTRDLEAMMNDQVQPWTNHPRMSETDLQETARRHRAASIKSPISPVDSEMAMPPQITSEMRSRATTMKDTASPRMDASGPTGRSEARQRSTSLKNPRPSKITEESGSAENAHKRSFSLRSERSASFDIPVPPIPSRTHTPTKLQRKRGHSNSSMRLSHPQNSLQAEQDVIAEVPSRNQ